MYWYGVRDGDRAALGLYLRHYSSAVNRARPRQRACRRPHFAGVGQKMVLLTSLSDAIALSVLAFLYVVILHVISL